MEPMVRAKAAKASLLFMARFPGEFGLEGFDLLDLVYAMRVPN